MSALRYSYYPGCSLHASASEYDISTREVFAALEILGPGDVQALEGDLGAGHGLAGLGEHAARDAARGLGAQAQGDCHPLPCPRRAPIVDRSN